MEHEAHINQGFLRFGISKTVDATSSHHPSVAEILGTENGVFTSRLPGEEDFHCYPKRPENNINWKENIPSEEHWKKWHERHIPPLLTSLDWRANHPGQESVRKVTNEKVEVNNVDSSRPSHYTLRDDRRVVLKIFPRVHHPGKKQTEKMNGKGNEKIGDSTANGNKLVVVEVGQKKKMKTKIFV